MEKVLDLIKCHDFHKPYRSFDEIEIGELIVIKAPVYGAVLKVKKKNKKSLVCTLLTGKKESRTVWYKDYIYSYIVTPEYMNAYMYRDDFACGFSTAEKTYGINHHGSRDPDPVRQLAFRILKGDPVARDIAMDVIARGS